MMAAKTCSGCALRKLRSSSIPVEFNGPHGHLGKQRYIDYRVPAAFALDDLQT